MLFFVCVDFTSCNLNMWHWTHNPQGSSQRCGSTPRYLCRSNGELYSYFNSLSQLLGFVGAQSLGAYPSTLAHYESAFPPSPQLSVCRLPASTGLVLLPRDHTQAERVNTCHPGQALRAEPSDICSVQSRKSPCTNNVKFFFSSHESFSRKSQLAINKLSSVTLADKWNEK